MDWQPSSHLSHEASTWLFAFPGVWTLRGDFSNMMNTQPLHTRCAFPPAPPRLSHSIQPSCAAPSPRFPSCCPHVHPCSGLSSSPPSHGNAKQELLALLAALRLSLKASQWHGSICHPKAEAQGSRAVPLSGLCTAAAGKAQVLLASSGLTGPVMGPSW